MKNYANGAITKERILEVSKELFYKKGYNDTKYADICTAANANPGTVSHHFKSKKNIASILYRASIVHFNETVQEIFPQEDELQQVMISKGIHYYLIFADAKYRQFSCEYTSDRVALGITDYIDNVSRAFKVTSDRVGREKAEFLFMAFKGMDCYIEPYIDENIDKLTFEDIYDNVASLHYQFLDKDELHGRIERAIACVKSLNISFDEFRFNIRKSA